MDLTFLGATQTVTGSKYLLTTRSARVLVDCGLYQGFKPLRLRNRAPFPVDPREIDAVVLTHAHVDHSGYLPVLVKNGFKGPVFCTSGTRDLCGILLPDSGHLQEEEALFANRHGFSKHKPALPLYTREDAIASLRGIVPVDYGKEFLVGKDLTFTFRQGGHIIGASIVEARATERGRQTLAVFSGDLGRPADPLLRPPDAVHDADYLVVESTYGDRVHDPADPSEALADAVNRTAARGGVVLVPVFAVGRAQALLWLVHLLKQRRAIPDLPVFMDSPMAVSATQIFLDHQGEHRLTADECERMSATAVYVNSVEESKALDASRVPAIVLSASGMATGGRVLHHMKVVAPDPRNTILFVGFQAGGTRGANLVAGADSVKIHGEYVPVRAEVRAINNLSAHADSTEILRWLGNFSRPPVQTFITHGEPSAADGLRRRIADRLGWECSIPEYRDRVALDPR